MKTLLEECVSPPSEDDTTGWTLVVRSSPRTDALPEWVLVSGARPSRCALVALRADTEHLQQVVRRGSWELSGPAPGSVLSLELSWCMRLPDAGSVVLFGRELPDSTV